MSELDTKKPVPKSLLDQEIDPQLVCGLGHSSRCANGQIRAVTGLLWLQNITIACPGFYRAPIVGLASKGRVHLTENIATEGTVRELHRAQGLDTLQPARVPAYIAAR